MELNKHDIAERFSALHPEKQKEFLSALKKRGLDFSLLTGRRGGRRSARPGAAAGPRGRHGRTFFPIKYGE